MSRQKLREFLKVTTWEQEVYDDFVGWAMTQPALDNVRNEHELRVIIKSRHAPPCEPAQRAALYVWAKYQKELR